MFKLGQVVMTRGINNAAAEDTKFSNEIFGAFAKYTMMDWGNTCKEDWKMNDEALRYDNDRVVAKYETSRGDVFIITEWDRSVTTILFAEEY